MTSSSSAWDPTRHSLFGLKQEVHLGAVDRVGVSADLATTDPGDHRLDLRQLHELSFNTQRHLSALGERDGWRHGQTQDKGALLE